jgi:hypothetical protein
MDTLNRDKPHPAAASPAIPDWGRLLWFVPVAVAAATIANVIFYFILTRLLDEPLLMNAAEHAPPVLSPMDVSNVILISIIFSLAASFVYAFLSAVTQRPERNFMIISAVVLLASLVPLLGVPNSPVAMSARLGLVTMHIIGAVVVVGLLVRLGRSRV